MLSNDIDEGKKHNPSNRINYRIDCLESTNIIWSAVDGSINLISLSTYYSCYYTVQVYIYSILKSYYL